MPSVSEGMGYPLRGHRLAANRGLAGLLIATMLLLVACTDPSEQRAVQPGGLATYSIPTQYAVASPTSAGTPVAISSTPIAATPFSAASVAQAAATRIYFTRGGDLWQIPVDSGSPAPVLAGHSILAFAPSPGGDQVAVIYLSGNSDQEHLANFSADGTSMIDVTLSIPSDDQTSRGGDIQSIAWSPDGNRVAVARQDGSISAVTRSGTMSEVLKPDKQHFPGALSVSPDGRTLLYLDPSLPGRATSLYTIPISGGVARRVVDGSQANHPVLAASWLPNSNRIAYIQAVASSPSGTGDVFTVDSASVRSELAVASAQFAPVAGIGDVAFSDDGRWVAFTLYLPDDSGSSFQGLWLMNLETRVTQQVPIEAGQAVTDLWWGQGTLLYRTIKTDDTSSPERYSGLGSFALYSVKPDGSQPVLRYREP